MKITFPRWTTLVSSVFVFAALYILSPRQTFAATYYIDSVGGSDTNAGTSEASAWKTLSKPNSTSFAPGDVVKFKRGGEWDGPLNANDSGTASAPVTYTSYGSGSKPVITGRNGVDHKRAIEISASWVVIDDLMINDAAESGIEIFEGNKSTKIPFDNNVIKNVDFRNIGIGVTIKSNNNRVENCTFDTFKMVRDTDVPTDDDYGAIAVNLNADAARTNIDRQNLSGNVITHNTVKNAKAPSKDYTVDGGFVEIFNDVDNTEISYNWVENSKGFIEIGGTQHTATVENLKIHHNISVNNGLFSFVNTGTYGIGVKNFQVANNVLYEATADRKTAFWFDGPVNIGPDEFQLKNNILYLRATVSNKPTILHQNNIYYRLDRNADQSNTSSSDIGYSIENSEKIADAKFVNAAGNDFHLSVGSPAILAGQNLGFAVDFAGQALQPTGPVDIGAYRYMGADNTPTPSPSPSPSASPMSCAEDINEDHVVNVFDFSILSNNFLDTDFSPTRADVNRDGKVDLLDYAQLITKLLQNC